MDLRAPLAAVLLAAAAHGLAFGQTLDARRTGMGGVTLPSGPGAEGVNAACRAVPRAPDGSSGLSLPIGLVPLVADPPVLDPDDPEFNIYELANAVYNPPWNLQLVEPEPPSSDIVLTLGRDHLGVQLGEVAALFPDDESRFGAVARTPGIGFGLRGFHAGLSAVAHYENTLRLNDPLHAALTGGEPFRTNTDYRLWDDGRGQVAAALQLGWAGAVRASGRPRDPDGHGLYAGVRARVLRGLAYGDARNQVAFVTGDTLFSSSPVELDYLGRLRTAGPAAGGWGQALDLGLVWLVRGWEVGVGANDLGARVGWKVEESVAARDSATGEIVRVVTGEDVPFTSEIPASVTVNAARRFGRTTVAADVVHAMDAVTTHLGVEHWLPFVALRAGAGLDSRGAVQYAGGLGLKLGRFGVDAAVASHSRNLSRERGLELGLGLALYH
jgi:hypothetical protein